MAVGDVGAANVVYVGANGGYWDIAGNWNPGLPTTPDDVALGAFNTEFRTGSVTIHTFTGTGNLRVSGGSLRTTAASSIGSLTVVGGTMSGAGTVTAGSLTFTNGQLGESGQAAGTTTVTGATTFDGTSSQNIYYGRTLNLNGGATWSAGAQGIISIYSGGQGTSSVNIASGTTFADQGNLAANQVRYLGYQTDGIVNNAGTYTRTGLGTTQVNAAFNNTGTVNVNGGAISLVNGGTSSGAFNVASGATLNFGSGYALTTGSIANAGTVTASSGLVTVAAPVTLTGAGALTVNGGTLRVAGNSFNPATLNMTSGTLSGAGTVTAGTLAFSGGQMGENGQTAGTTTVTGATTFDGTGAQYIYYGRTLNLNGGATWTTGAQGTIALYSGGQGTSIVNLASGSTFADQGNVAANQTRNLGNNADGVFNNAGTYTRTGLGTTQVNAAFNNTGTVNVNGGAMSLLNGGTSSGAFNLASGTALNFGSGYSLTTGSIANAGTVTASSGLVTVAAPVTLTGAGALTVNGGTLRVAGNSFNPATLNMIGGTLSGAGTVTAGTLVFTNGQMGESGQTAGITTVTGATTFDGTGNQYVYYGRTLNLNGGATWTTGSQGVISLYSGGQGTSTVNVASGSTFTDQGNALSTQVRYLGNNSDGVFNNAGTYARTGLGTTQVAATFNNTGTVSVTGGAFSLNNGGTSSGAFAITSGSTLAFGSGTYALTGGSIANAGTLAASGATVNINSGVTYTGSGTIAVSAGLLNSALGTTLAPGALNLSGGTARFTGAVNATALSMTGGTLSGPGTVTAGALMFSSGTMGESGQGGGTTTVTGATTFDGTSNQYVYYGRTLNLNGGATWSTGNQGVIALYSGSQGTTTLNVASGTTFTDQGNVAANQTRYLGNNSDGVFNNAGTYTRTGLGTTQVSAIFNNTGTVSVTGGTFNLLNGGTSSGAFAVTSGNTLGFGSGTYALTGGSIANAGTLAVSGATVNINSGVTYTGSGTIAVSAGLLNSALGTTLTPGALNLSGGTARFAGAVNTTSLSMTGGTLSGAGTVTAGTLTFSSGTMGENGQGGGTTTVTGAATFDGTQNQYVYYGRTLNLNGGATWTTGNQGVIALYSGSQGTTTLNVASGTTFADQGNVAANQTRYLGNNSDGVFNNAGTYTRTGLGTTQASATFNNTGTVNVNGGAMSLLNGGTSSGAFNVASGTTLNFGSGYALTTGSIANAGTVTASSGVVTVAAPVTLTGAGALTVSGGTLRVAGNSFNPATLNMTSGTLSGAGTVTAGTLVFTNGTMGETGQGGGTTTVTGATTFDGTGNQYVYYGRTLNLNGGATWTTGAQGTIALYSGSQGTSALNVASGTTFADQGNVAANQTRYLGNNSDGVFNNAGTYTRTGLGTTQVSAAFNNTGTVNVNGGAISLVNGGTSSGAFNVASGATLNFGSGYALTTGSIANAGTVTASSGLVTLAAPVTLTGPGALTVNGGTLRVAGNGIAPTTLNMTGGTLSGVGTVTAGTLVFTGGTMGETGQGGGTTTVTGATTFDGTSSQNVYYGRTLNLNGGATWTTGTQGFISVSASNQGTTSVNIASGTTFADQGNVAANQTRYLGYYGDGVVNNAGTYTRTGLGTTQVNATFNNTGTVNVNAGAMSLLNGGTSSGAFNVASGTTLNFGSGYSLTTGSIADAGTVTASSGIVTMSAPVTLTGAGALTVNGGTLRVAGNGIAPAALNMTAGTLSGVGTVTAGTLVFTSGTMGETGQGGGTTTVTGATTFDGTNSQYVYYGRTLNLNGGTTWAASTQGLIAISASSQGTTSVNIGAGTTFADQGNIAANQTRYLGYYSDGVVNNAGTYTRTGLGTTQVNATFNNTGLVNVNAGAMAFSNGGIQGTGTLQTSGTGTVTLAAASTTGVLNLTSSTANNLALGGNNIVVSSDYTNAAFGTGNSFNARANVSGTGLVNGLRAAQSITGAGVTNGTAATATLTIGNVRVGANTVNYQVANSGTGASIRGAIQTVGTGLGVSDSRLSGTGVTAQNFGPIVAGTNGGNLAVTFTAANAGALAPLTGTNVIGIVNNFDNVADQKLNLSLGSGAAAFQVAAGSILTSPLNFGTVQVGQAVSQVLAIKNTATGPSGYVEDLNASFGASSGTGGNLITGTGSISSLVAGATNSSGLTVNVNTASAGSVSGAIAVNFASAGTVGGTSNGLGALSLGSSSYGVTGTITGTVVNQASPLINNALIALGNARVGATSPTTAVSVTNQATTSPQAALSASIVGSAPITASGSFSLLNPGSTNASSLTVGMDTTSAGSKSGTATLSFISDASNIGNCAPNCQVTLASQNVAVSGGVYQVAQASVPTTVNLGNVHVGGSASQAIAIGNTNTAPTGFQEGLDVAVGATTGGATGSGSISNLTAGNSSNAVTVGLANVGSGARSGTVALGLASNGTGTSGLATLSLGSSSVTVNATGYNLAAGSVTPTPVAFGNQRVGGTASQALTVTNTGPSGVYTEGLNASFAGSTGATVNNGGSVSLLAAQASNASALSVRLDTSSSGAKTGTTTVGFVSDGTGTSGLGTTAAGSQTINLSGSVFQVAAGSILTSPLNFGTVQVGQTVSQTLAIKNIATGAAGYVEDLNASFGASSGTGSSLISGTGSIAGLVAGATNSSGLTVSVNTATAGSVSGAIAVNFASAGAVAGTSNGLGVLSVGSGSYGVTGTIATAATVVNQASPLINNGTIALGNVRVGATSPTTAVSVTNQATMSPQAALSASIVGSAPITASGSFSLLNPGSTNASSLTVGMDTTSAGSKSGTATLSFISDASNIGNCAPNCQVTLASQNVAVSGGVYQVAQASVPTTVNLGNVHVGGSASQAIAIGNTNTAPTGFQEGLDVAVGATTGGATGSGSISNLTAGNSSNAVTVGLANVGSGARSGTVALGLASNGTGTSGLATLSLGSSSVTVNATGYNLAAGSVTPTPVAFGNQRVGGTASQALTVTNTGPSGVYTEGLNASFTGSTGATVNNGGSVSLLAAQASNASALSVRLDTSSSGAKTGTTTVGFVSDGTGTSGLGTTAAGSQTINLSGSVFQVAAGSILTSPLNFGTVQVGQTVSQTLAIKNIATGAAGYVEDLNASFGASSGTGSSLISGTGSIAGLVAGATNSSGLTVSVNTATAGSVSGAIAVNFASAGAVAGTSNGLGVLSVGSGSYGVTGTIATAATVVNQASPLINNGTIALGNVRVGATSPTTAVSVTNQATTSPQAALSASIVGSAPITASGSFSLLNPGSTNASSLTVGMDTTSAGSKSGTATLSFISDASNIGNCAPNCQVTLASQNVAVSGAVYRLANPSATPSAITVAGRVGTTPTTTNIAITNVSPDAYTEGLTVSRGATSNGFTSSGGITNLTAGATSSAIGVTLNTATAGSFTGSQALAYVSTGAGTTGAADLAVGSGSVTLNGKVYTPAAATVNTSGVNFGIVHVGDAVASRSVSVTNSAATTALNDVLVAQAIGATGPFTAAGSLGTGLAAQQTATSLSVGLGTSAAGVYNGTASFSAASHDGDLSDAALANLAVALSGQVNNYATDAFRLAGGAGTLTQSGSTYVLDYGTVVQNTGVRTTSLAAGNTATGSADLLDGSFAFNDVADFGETGFNSFANFVAGQSTGPLMLSFNSGSLGSFADSITLSGIGHNASGYSAAIGDLQLIVRGNVIAASSSTVPEPNSLWLLGLGVPLLLLRRRSRRGAVRH